MLCLLLGDVTPLNVHVAPIHVNRKLNSCNKCINRWTLIAQMCFSKTSAHVQNILHIQNISHISVFCVCVMYISTKLLKLTENKKTYFGRVCVCVCVCVCACVSFLTHMNNTYSN